jgi:hypothetical protein
MRLSADNDDGTQKDVYRSQCLPPEFLPRCPSLAASSMEMRQRLEKPVLHESIEPGQKSVGWAINVEDGGRIGVGKTTNTAKTTASRKTASAVQVSSLCSATAFGPHCEWPRYAKPHNAIGLRAEIRSNWSRVLAK